MRNEKVREIMKKYASSDPGGQVDQNARKLTLYQPDQVTDFTEKIKL